MIRAVFIQTDLETEGRETVVAHRDDPQYRCMNIEREVKEVCDARPRPKPSAPSARRNASRKARNRLDGEVMSDSSLPGDVCLTCSDGLLIGYKVARQFEFHPLRQRVFSFRDSLFSGPKNAHLAGIRDSRSTGEPVSSGSNASFKDFSLFALLAVDLACRWVWHFTLNKDCCRSAVDRDVLRPVAQIRGLAFAPPSPLEYQNGRSVVLAR
jgi:hypothetical protein